jgi:hypothetical protein
MREKTIGHYWVFRYVVFVSIGLILARFLNHVLLEALTIFLWPLLLLSLLALMIVGVIWAIVFWWRCGKQGIFQQGRWRRSLPLIVQLGAVVVTLVVPFEQFWLSLNFHQHLQARQQVVALVQSNQLPFKLNNISTVPPAYRETTIKGEIQTLRSSKGLYVLFFTSRGFGGAEGFLYSENGQPPAKDLASGYQVVEQRPIDGNWYYVRIGDVIPD